MLDACNPRSWQAEAREFKASMAFIASLSQKEKNNGSSTSPNSSLQGWQLTVAAQSFGLYFVRVHLNVVIREG